MNATYTAALMRGLISALIAAGSAFFVGLSVNPGDYQGAFVLAGGALFTTLGMRFVGEGTLDSRNDIQRGADVAKREGMTPPVAITETTVSETDGPGIANTGSGV